ncbi:NAD(P)H-hydrate dehydratase [Rathayibacter sp. VKM Ac-2803]|uniref:ADP-dependent NAD(P)H-hydrate dehydratase n=1 Tax=Rathayibacter sp. VKM Ac-2803 TaxID=2609256 RepID=UPI00135CA63C|nr:ADP/ATP-dependent (S)-NAD(P)H-hydrate dehydratase [Rathayibacter sp. VKM Ac-2803]MWV48388.1 NAD(P)H-hydrate dehydratase [Rathayibacter sp. VKM Ac-2803]
MSEIIDRALLERDWPLPAAEGSKHARGDVVIIGGARKTPGAAILAGIAALRVGAGRITLCVAESVASATAVALPECGVIPLEESRSGSITGRGLDALSGELGSADVVLVGPGLDDPKATASTLRALVPLLRDVPAVHLDAFPLGILPGQRRVARALAGRLLLTPNSEEGARLLGGDVDDLEQAALAIARRYDAVVSLSNVIADPGGTVLRVIGEHSGLATAGSGDVLAGATAGLRARGAAGVAAAAWGTHLHTEADTRLAARLGPAGYLAREIPGEFPALLA